MAGLVLLAGCASGTPAGGSTSGTSATAVSTTSASSIPPPPRSTPPPPPSAPPPQSTPAPPARSDNLADFRVTDLSFVGTEDGWALGTVACTAGRCAALVRTTDGGRTWQALPRPPADVVDPDQEVPRCGAPCLEHVRFATDRIGYLFGDGMWAPATDR